MAIALPLTFWWQSITGMYFFAGIMGASSQGGAITSILLRIPGTAQNAATMFDGHPLALIPVFLPILLAFGPAEKFWLMIFGLVAMTLAVRADMTKGFLAVGLGVLMTFVGFGENELGKRSNSVAASAQSQ